MKLTVESMKLHLATWPPKKQIEQTLGQASAQEKALKLHLAERDPQHHAWAKHGADNGGYHLRILLSYHYYKDTDLDQLFEKYFTEPYPDVFADSGAFSAMTQGSYIDIDDYANWLKKYNHLFSTYSNLDVIKDADGTWENQVYLEEKHGLSPLPVFHVLESFDWLERYIEKYQYIALGVAGMQQRGGLMAWLTKCFQMAKGRAVYHGFGLTGWKVMRDFPWYSVDSSSWGQGFRFGQVPVFNTNKGRFEKLKLGDVTSWQRHGQLIDSMGFNWHDFAYRERNDRAKICAISALSYMMAQKWLRKRHGEIYIPNDNGAPAVLRAHLRALVCKSARTSGADIVPHTYTTRR